MLCLPSKKLHMLEWSENSNKTWIAIRFRTFHRCYTRFGLQMVNLDLQKPPQDHWKWPKELFPYIRVPENFCAQLNLNHFSTAPKHEWWWLDFFWTRSCTDVANYKSAAAGIQTKKNCHCRNSPEFVPIQIASYGPNWTNVGSRLRGKKLVETMCTLSSTPDFHRTRSFVWFGRKKSNERQTHTEVKTF